MLLLNGLVFQSRTPIMYQNVTNKDFAKGADGWADINCSFDHGDSMESLYSPYLEFVGPKRWGHYLGVKAEWWIWN